MGKSFRWEARYTVLSILLIINVVSFMDRTVMSVAIPYIALDFHLSPLAMGVVMSAFFASYSISQIPGGLLADRFGVRRVATTAMLWWSAFTAITGAASNLTHMLIARFAFGLGEGVYPACAFKTVAISFPKSERATATGMLLACSSLGSALAPLMVVPIVALWGWRAVFYVLFIPGVVTALLFWFFIKDSPADTVEGSSPQQPVETEDGAIVLAENPGTKASRVKILMEPKLLKLFFVLFTFDLAYWGFTTWLPTYLVKERGFSMGQMGVAASLPSFAGIVGCILGGWASERFFSNNRRLPIIISELGAALSLYLMFSATSTTTLLVSQTVAGFCIFVFFSTFWALPMNMVPKEVMGVASGFINMAGQLAAFASPIFIGYLVGATGNFDLTFAFLIGSLLLSCGIVFTLAGKSPQPEA